MRDKYRKGEQKHQVSVVQLTLISCSEAFRTLIVVAFFVFCNCNWLLSLSTASFKSFLLNLHKMFMEEMLLDILKEESNVNQIK